MQGAGSRDAEADSQRPSMHVKECSRIHMQRHDTCSCTNMYACSGTAYVDTCSWEWGAHMCMDVCTWSWNTSVHRLSVYSTTRSVHESIETGGTCTCMPLPITSLSECTKHASPVVQLTHTSRYMEWHLRGGRVAKLTHVHPHTRACAEACGLMKGHTCKLHLGSAPLLFAKCRPTSETDARLCTCP